MLEVDNNISFTHLHVHTQSTKSFMIFLFVYYINMSMINCYFYLLNILFIIIQLAF